MPTPQCPVSCFEKVFIFALAFPVFPCYSISAGRGGPRSYFPVAGLIYASCQDLAATHGGCRIVLPAQPYSGIVWRLRHLAKRPLRGLISLMPRRSVNQSGSWTADRGRCAIQDTAGLSSPLPGSCASSCLAVFPGFSIRRLSLTFKTGSFPGEQVIGESPIGVSIVRGLGRRDKASDSCAVHFSFCYNQQKSSAPGCAARGAVTFYIRISRFARNDSYRSFRTATARSSSWGYRWA